MDDLVITLPRPHAEQAKILRDPARFKVLRCGRRFGKTTAGVIAACEAALAGQTVGWFAPTYKYLLEAWDRILGILRPVVVRENASERQIKILTGGVLDFWTLVDDDIGRGRSYDLAWIDEAGMVQDLATRLVSIRPTLADRKGRLVLSGTPKGRGHFATLYDLGQEGREGWKSWQLGTVANPHMDPEEIEATRRSMTPEQAAQELDGVPMADSGNPFGIDRIRARVAPVSPGPAVVIGADLARAEDWTVVVGLDADGRVCLFDRWQRLPWEATVERLAQLIGATPALVDATGVGDPIVERLKQRLPNVTGFVFTSTSKQALMDTLALAIHGADVAYPDGPIVKELEAFEYQYRGGRAYYSAPHGLHDDCVMALALAVKARRDESLAYRGPVVILPNAREEREDDWA